MEDVIKKYLCNFCINKKDNCKNIKIKKEGNIMVTKCENYKNKEDDWFVRESKKFAKTKCSKCENNFTDICHMTINIDGELQCVFFKERRIKNK